MGQSRKNTPTYFIKTINLGTNIFWLRVAQWLITSVDTDTKFGHSYKMNLIINLELKLDS